MLNKLSITWHKFTTHLYRCVSRRSVRPSSVQQKCPAVFKIHIYYSSCKIGRNIFNHSETPMGNIVTGLFKISKKFSHIPKKREPFLSRFFCADSYSFTIKHPYFFIHMPYFPFVEFGVVITADLMTLIFVCIVLFTTQGHLSSNHVAFLATLSVIFLLQFLYLIFSIIFNLRISQNFHYFLNNVWNMFVSLSIPKTGHFLCTKIFPFRIVVCNVKGRISLFMHKTLTRYGYPLHGVLQSIFCCNNFLVF